MIKSADYIMNKVITPGLQINNKKINYKAAKAEAYMSPVKNW